MEGDGETHGSARKLSVFPIFFCLVARMVVIVTSW